MQYTRRLASTTTALLLSTAAHAQNFDLVISNCRVLDPETGFDQVASVGINTCFITEISTDTLDGTRVIDASGHVVAPGFIDFHKMSLATI